MYHQLCRATGRLVVANNLQSPLFPVAPIALQRVEPPQILYNTTHMSTVAEACPPSARPRNVPGTNTPYAPLSEKIRKKQELFQKDNDLPVYLKGGPLDALLYRFTMGLCIVGMVAIAHTVYKHAVPPKQN